MKKIPLDASLQSVERRYVTVEGPARPGMNSCGGTQNNRRKVVAGDSMASGGTKGTSVEHLALIKIMGAFFLFQRVDQNKKEGYGKRASVGV